MVRRPRPTAAETESAGERVHVHVNASGSSLAISLSMTDRRSQPDTHQYKGPFAPDAWRGDNITIGGPAQTGQITLAQLSGLREFPHQPMLPPKPEVRTRAYKERPTKRAAEVHTTDVSPNSPLRLELAAQLAFPAGGMTAAGLRREAAKGRLVIERIAGKDYTTLAAIDGMRALCRTDPKALDCGSGRRVETRNQLGSSETDRNRSALDAAQMIATKLRSGSRLI
jgi:hypothetical protein